MSKKTLRLRKRRGNKKCNKTKYSKRYLRMGGTPRPRSPIPPRRPPPRSPRPPRSSHPYNDTHDSTRVFSNNLSPLIINNGNNLHLANLRDRDRSQQR